MPGTPEISVCIPVYNAEPYLQQCIDSLLDQTVSMEREYIFVNDCSTDTSGEILRRNQAAHPDKIRVLEHTENLGPGGARNTAMDAAKGRYIGFVDSDDFVSPRMYEVLYRNAIETGADVTYIQRAVVKADEKYDKDKTQYNEGKNAPGYPLDEHILRWHNRGLTDEGRMDLRCYTIWGDIWTALWRKSMLSEHDVRFPNNLHYENGYFGTLAMCYFTKVAFVPETMYYQRLSPGSISRSYDDPHQLDRMEIERMVLEESKRRNLFERYYPMWEYNYSQRYVFATSIVFIRRFSKPPMEALAEMRRDLRKNFPEWRKNRYYKSVISWKTRLMNEMIYYFPRLSTLIIPTLLRLAGKIWDE